MTQWSIDSFSAFSCGRSSAMGISGVEALKALAAGPLVHANLCAAELVERSLKRCEGQLAANGALVSVTGARSGRSPKDKFTVDDAVTHELVDWGKVNKPFAPEKFGALLERVVEHQKGRELFAQDLYCGADAVTGCRFGSSASLRGKRCLCGSFLCVRKR